jgi:hypothetical protein
MASVTAEPPKKMMISWCFGKKWLRQHGFGLVIVEPV